MGSKLLQQPGIGGFLERFQLIFTLNQDSLLELLYDRAIIRTNAHFPGVHPAPEWTGANLIERARITWRPEGDLVEERESQPVYKLHGSANWRTAAQGGEPMMIMGGGKEAAINASPLLRQYSERFRQILNSGGTKLMIIGYSFQDEHINRLLIEASAEHELQIYLIDPRGLAIFDSPPDQQIRPINPLAELRVVGVSMRTLHQTFSSADGLQLNSLLRFLS